jgi:NifB/MoaA-like Fe-S oxidoreductase
VAHLEPGPTLQRLLVEAVREHNVLPLTGRCNLSCVFCSHRHNPPDAEAYSFPPLTEDCLQGLIPFLNSAKKIIIGESATRLREGEPLSHPQFLPLIRQLRRLHPVTTIQLTTNASLLDEKTVYHLGRLKPLEVVVSLNSATVKGRSLLMGDPHPQRAVEAVGFLQSQELPFHGSIVALPHLVGWADLHETVAVLDGAGAVTLRLLLPGYTQRSVPEAVAPVGNNEACYRFATEVKSSLTAPLVVEPPLIEDLISQVEGVIKGSPAEKAGFKTGDLIDSVDGVKPRSRVEAFELANSKKQTSFSINRQQKSIELIMQKGSRSASGLVMSYDLDPAQVERVQRLLSDNEKTLMLVSEPALKRWQIAAITITLPGLTFKTVTSSYFGGSINCAGLLTISDFARALSEIEDLGCYSKILLPAIAFDSTGRDMRGMHYLTLRPGSSKIRLIN